MKIALGADSAGAPLLRVILEHLQSRPDLDASDLTGSPDGRAELYPEIAARVALKVLSGEYERGILFCGTGIGMCISANKVPGIRAALTHDTYSAERARKSNNAQIITMGARVIGPELAKYIADTWLRCEFDPSSHSARNVAAIDALDERFARKQAPRVA